MSETQSQGTEIEQVAQEIDGMDYYGVTLIVTDVNRDRIDIKLIKDRSARHWNNSCIKWSDPYYADSKQWISNADFAVVEKAIKTLNSRVGDPEDDE